MGLKQIKSIDRIVFLKMFVEEILINVSREYELRKVIELEKVKKKIFEPISEKIPVFHYVESKKEIKEKHDLESKKEIKEKSEMELKKESKKNIEEEKLTRKIPFHFVKYRKMAPSPRLKSLYPVDSKSNLSGIEKIKRLLNDSAIQSIECPGPGKYLIIKRQNKMNVTRTTLIQKEILEVIDYYSKEARIPISSGILKAAVGNLLISAVSSQLIGSRFIISRKTPYSLIGGTKLLPEVNPIKNQ